MSNADETHFVFNMDNSRTLVICGNEEVRYADVTSGGEGITMLVRLRGGQAATAQPSFLIFINNDRNYPIRGFPDNISAVPYRGGPKDWMVSTNMLEFLNEERTIKALPDGKMRTIFTFYCSSHIMNEDVNAAEAILTTLRYVPTNTTELNQSCGSFFIQKLKEAWRK